RERQADVVYLDVSNRRRPFGINLLDTGLGWDRDQATANALRIFRREFDGYWGPRMEDAFRFAVLALFEANEAMCAEDPRGGRGAQHTILDVPAVLERPGFRRQVLKKTRDPVIRQWFEGYFQSLDQRFQLEIINPVQTKVHKYLGSRVARQIAGQPRSTIDFRQLVATGKLVIVNLNAFDVGEDTAALIGGTLLNLAARAISAQALLTPEQRKPVTLVVDEFHSLPGADYEQLLGELAKYGANVLLATQTLSRLDRLTDAQRTRNLRASVFSNLDGLFAFHTSAEDAAYLAEELGGGLDAQDLLEMGHYQCYARLTDVRTGERLPTFSVQLEPPPDGDDQLASRLARLSAEHYGRDALDVELDLQSAMERIRGPQKVSEADKSEESAKPPEPAPPNTGTPAAGGVVIGAEVPGT
ncbi:MAG: type IV secretory system conjugative DNA transfer family protein, partial [Chloroflexota bacterium]